MNETDILKKLNENGYQAYLVGGCVRDRLLGREPADSDITTDALPDEIKRVFAGERIIETGLKHGTVTVLTGGVPYEITTFRRDGTYSDGRHPDSVSFSAKLEEDLKRRDFTVNAMAIDADGRLIDPFGGREDLAAGLIRAVGDPRERFDEDALRILRALRFSSTLGFEIEESTARAAFELAPRLDLVSRERCYAEIRKTLCGKNVQSVLVRYWEILCAVVPELQPMRAFDQKNPHHVYTLDEHTARVVSRVPPLPALRFAALLHDIGKPHCQSFDAAGCAHYYNHAVIGAEIAERVMHGLKADKKTTEKVTFLVRYHDAPAEETKEQAAKKLRRYGLENYRDLIALRRADNLAQAPGHERTALHDRDERFIKELLEEERCFSLKDLALHGDDLIALGIRKGPAVGRALELLLNAVLEGKAENNRSSLEKYFADHFDFKA